MADNVTLNAGTGGSTLKTDENASSEHYQIIKVADGTADSDTVIAAGNGVAANALRVTLPTDGTGVVGLNTGSNTIGEVTIGAATTAAGDLAKAEDAAHATGDVGVMALAVRKATPANVSGTDGDYEPLQVSAGHLWTYAAGGVAHDAADSGNPVKIGAVAKEMDGSDPGSVAENDRTDLRADLNGRLLVSEGHPNGFNVSDNQASAQTNTALQSAPGSGLHIYVTDFIISADGNNDVKLVEDTGGTPTTILNNLYFSGNTTVTAHFSQPIRLSENVDLGYTSTGTNNLTVAVSGYIAP